MVSDRVRLEGAKFASATQRNSILRAVFRGQLRRFFEVFPPKRVIRELLCVRQNPQKGSTLTFTEQALTELVKTYLTAQEKKDTAAQTRQIIAVVFAFVLVLPAP